VAEKKQFCRFANNGGCLSETKSALKFPFDLLSIKEVQHALRVLPIPDEQLVHSSI